jgi:hypothetical protein
MAVAAIAPAEIAAANAGAPGGNGNALDLAALEKAELPSGVNFAGAYGSLAGRVGEDLEGAQNDSDSRQSLLTRPERFAPIFPEFRWTKKRPCSCRSSNNIRPPAS